MLRGTVVRGLIPVGVVTLGFGVYQGQQIRNKYRRSQKIDPPSGPSSGLETWVDRIRETKDEIIEKCLSVEERIENENNVIKQGLRKVKKIVEAKKEHRSNENGTREGKDSKNEQNGEEPTAQRAFDDSERRRRIRLIVLGDSLVSGVGCDSSTPILNVNANSSAGSSLNSGVMNGSSGSIIDGPVLPRVIAKVLSLAMKADVEWSSAGLVGGTVQDIRQTIVPQLRSHLLSGGNATAAEPDNDKESNHMQQLSAGKNDHSISLSHPVASTNAITHWFASLLRVLTFYVPYANSNLDTTAGSSIPSAAGPSEYSEVIVVVICGLNDWKTTLETFPSWKFGGPNRFHDNLGKLVEEIQECAQSTLTEVYAKNDSKIINSNNNNYNHDNTGAVGVSKDGDSRIKKQERKGSKTVGRIPCRVFLPALPIRVAQSDPDCSISRKPLNYLVSAISWTWDIQKEAVATEDPQAETTYIKAPSVDSPFATPGKGNVCSDGVHPSNQGYTWWGRHIGHEILQTIGSSASN